MLLPRAFLVPHLPTLVLDEQRRHHTPMLEALQRAGECFRAERPEIVVVVSAHGESTGPFQVGNSRAHRSLTDDPGLGVEVRYDCPGHPRLARALVEAGIRSGVRVGATPRGVDGGVCVPLHFLLPVRHVPVVPLALADRPAGECRAWGAILRQVLIARPERIGFVVGGMLSHATHAWNFHREVPEAAVLDQHVLTALVEGRWSELVPRDPRVFERARPEAGLRHLELLRGFLDADVSGEVLCYESDPGMGSALVAFDVPGGVSVGPEPATAHVPLAPPVFPVPHPVPRPVPRRTDAWDKPAARPPRRRTAKARNAGAPRPAQGRGSATPRPRDAGARPAGRRPRDVSAGSRTPRPRGQARAPRPARKRPG